MRKRTILVGLLTAFATLAACTQPMHQSVSNTNTGDSASTVATPADAPMPTDAIPQTPAPTGAGPSQHGEPCGGVRGMLCANDLYCSYGPGTNCGRFDRIGICQRVPDACTEEYAPVCGCDGETYSNACFALMNRTSVLHNGECTAG